MTDLEPELAEPPEIDGYLPGPPRITGRDPTQRVPPAEPLAPPEPETGEIEIRPLLTELGIHPGSIPPPKPVEPDADGSEASAPAARGPEVELDALEHQQLAPETDVVGAVKPDPAEPEGMTAQGATALPESWPLVPPPGARAPTLLAAAMLSLGGLGAGTAITLLATEDDGPAAPAAGPAASTRPPIPAGATPVPAPTPGPIALLPRAFAIDPYGGDGEHQDRARLAVDGDPATAWATQRYSTGALGKPGVGLAVTAVSPARPRSLIIRTPTPGFAAEIYGAGARRPAGGARRGWIRLAGRTTVRSGRPIRLTTETPPMRHWLVWIVALAPRRDRAEIAEVGLRG